MVVRFHCLLLDKRQMLKNILYIVDIYKLLGALNLLLGQKDQTAHGAKKNIFFSSWFLPYSKVRVREIPSTVSMCYVNKLPSYCLSGLHLVIGIQHVERLS